MFFLRRGWGGGALGNFQTNIPAAAKKKSCKDSHGGKHQAKFFYYPGRIFHVTKILAQAILTKKCHSQP